MPHKTEEEGDEDDLITFPTQQQQPPQQQPPVQQHQFQHRYPQRQYRRPPDKLSDCCVLSFKHH